MVHIDIIQIATVPCDCTADRKSTGPACTDQAVSEPDGEEQAG